MTTESEAPLLSIFAGPNGSGKSTVTGPLLAAYGDSAPPYLNADEIAKNKYLPLHGDIERANLEAALEMQSERKRFISQRISFCFETVFSTPGKLRILEDAKAQGFEVHVIFVATGSADINVRRVQTRVAKGGHNVREETIRERYGRALKLLPMIADRVDRLTIFDNSKDHTQNAFSAVDMEWDNGSLTLREFDLSACKPAIWVWENFTKIWGERRHEYGVFNELAGKTCSFAKLGHIYTGPVIHTLKHYALQHSVRHGYVVHDLSLNAPKRQNIYDYRIGENDKWRDFKLVPDNVAP